MLNPCGPSCQNVPHFLKISQSLLNLIFLLVRLESSRGYDPKHPLVAFRSVGYKLWDLGIECSGGPVVGPWTDLVIGVLCCSRFPPTF